MLLIRTARIDPDVEALADRLHVASNERVVMLVDERRGSAGPSRHDKLGLTIPHCRRLGLHTPSDFAWRCGDYGFYLARDRFPEEQWFWMVEYDVRIGGDAGRFFAACAMRKEIDLLVAHAAPAGPDWWWQATVSARDATPWRCFFPVLRLSARAADILTAKRRAQSRRLGRRALWPNDESFVATTAVHAGLAVADFNDLGERFYDDATYSYQNVIAGEDFEASSDAPRLHHPVLSGEDYRRKLRRQAEDHGAPTPITERAYRKLVARLNGLTPW